MRVTAFFVAAFSVLSAANAYAQVEMTVPEAGRVKTIAKVEKRHPRHIQLIHTIPRDGARMRGGMLLRIGHKNQGLDLPRLRLQP